MGVLTEKQELFVLEYLIDLNATQAAIRAGYSARSARNQANRLMTNDDIQEAIKKANSERLERIKVDSDHVLQRLIEIDSLDISDIFNDNGTVKPFSQWPKSWLRSVSNVDITEKLDEEGSSIIKKQIRRPDPLKAIELLGKHVAIQAFKDKVEHQQSDIKLVVNRPLSELLKEGSKK